MMMLCANTYVDQVFRVMQFVKFSANRPLSWSSLIGFYKSVESKVWSFSM